MDVDGENISALEIDFVLIFNKNYYKTNATLILIQSRICFSLKVLFFLFFTSKIK